MAEKSLEEKIQRALDIHEIQNLMGRYEYLHTAYLGEETVELFAKKTPGVTVEIADWGVYEGIEGARKAFVGVCDLRGPGSSIGRLVIHTLTTSVIEVAGDGKTAKGIWFSPGLETFRIEGALRPMWTWVKYGCDFVKEDGEWKIWHFHVYAIFSPPFHKSWVEEPEHPPLPPVPDELKPDRPTTYHREYSPNGQYEHIPVPPEPYETWDGKSVA